jgi:hypothetical protein
MGERPSTRRLKPGLIESDITGRVTAEVITAIAGDYRKLGGKSIWVLAAAGATSYSHEAIQLAVDEFAALQREHGLQRIVAIIEKPLVRMSATIVSASLRSLGSPLEIRVVADRASADGALA